MPGINGVHGGIRIHIARNRRNTPKMAVAATELAGDSNSASGLARYRAGAGKLGALPWEAQPSAKAERRAWMRAMKREFISQAVPAAQSRTREVLQAHVSKLTPDALKAIEKLNGRGALEAVGAGGRSLIQEIDRYCQGKNADPQALEALLGQLADPAGSIEQAKPNTCTVAGFQKELAVSDPARYFRVATGLLDRGSAMLSGVGSVVLSAANRRAITNEGGSWNHKLNAVMQSAFMERANGKQASYDYKSDTSIGKSDGTDPFKGVTWAQAKTFGQQLLDAPALEMNRMRAAVRAGREQGLERFEVVNPRLAEQLAEAKANGELGVYVPLRGKGADKGHMVLLTGIENGQVQFLDASGGEPRRMAAADFGNRVTLLADLDIGNLRGRPRAAAVATELG